VPLHDAVEFATDRPTSWPPDVAFITMSDLPESGLVANEWRMVQAANIKSGVPIRLGDLLVAKITPCFENGKQGIVGAIPGGWGFATTEVHRLRPHAGVDIEYVAYFLRRPDVRQRLADAMEGTTGRQRLPRGALERLEIRVPPLDEQRRIARILSTIQRAEEAAVAVVKAKAKVHGAVMDRVFEPRSEWLAASLGEITLQRQYGLSLRGTPRGRIPILRMTNLRGGSVIFENLQYVNLAESDAAPYLVNPGDLLFNRTNSADLVGKVGIVHGVIPCVFASYLIRLVCDRSKVLPEFLNAYLNWTLTQATLRSMATRGVSQANISASTLATLQIPVPPLTTQREIASTVAVSQLALDRSIAESQRMGTLFSSVSAALFSQDNK